MKTKNILLITLGHKYRYFNGRDYKIPIACGGMEKNIINNLDILKNSFNVYLILVGLDKLPPYIASGIEIIPGRSYVFFLKNLIRNIPFGINNFTEKTTIIMVHNYFLFVIFSKLFKPKVKVCLFVESELSKLLWRPYGNIFTKLIYLLITLIGLSLADKIIKASNKTCWLEEKSTFIKRKSYYLQNALNKEMFKPFQEGRFSKTEALPNLKKDDLLLLYVGRVYNVDQKNPLLLFRSFEIVQKKFPEIKLLIVSPDIKKSKELFNKLDIQQNKNIYFTGPIPNDNLPEYYWASDLTLLTSNIEGASYAIIESLACGTPCVATNAIDNGIITDDINGYICKSKNPEDFAKTILKGLNLSAKIKSKGEDLLGTKYDLQTREKVLSKILSEL